MGYLTGFHAIEEALKAGTTPGPLLVAKAGPRAQESIALAREQKVPIQRVGTHELDRLAPDHRGVALRVEDLSPWSALSLEGFISALGERPHALTLILDEITDPHNYGAILRSCDHFAVDLVITRRRRIAKHAQSIAQTSAGAVSWVPVLEVSNLPRAVQDLKAARFWVYGADMQGPPLYEQDLRGRVTLILGGEGAGITRLLREACDAMVGIPRKGKIDSLNVSVAAGIVCYEALRQRTCGGHIGGLRG
ncbi:MAG: 23S rRNA (guanosine(2251)-2'-O)-methyltransferase RlmB [Spirochaetaceae bacterium]|jgi:23S rRNA (guanosine2251-2'-O)-methyltransferase|nr:23S rRNA (guanosine(2251)-2'-O)-methyltransferase RlmB [Spirochaetaceae bacterium]